MYFLFENFSKDRKTFEKKTCFRKKSPNSRTHFLLSKINQVKKNIIFSKRFSNLEIYSKKIVNF